MDLYKKLVGERCYLSPIALDHASAWARWFNDLEVTIPLGDEAYVPTSSSRENANIVRMTESAAHVFSIVDTSTDALIGRCLLFEVDFVNRTAKLGIVIGEKSYWNGGYGYDAGRLLLDYAFNLLNLNSVMLGAFAFNRRAIRCYEKLGFREVGRLRQARILAGAKHDVVLMDMLAEEFAPAHIHALLEKNGY